MRKWVDKKWILGVHVIAWRIELSNSLYVVLMHEGFDIANHYGTAWLLFVMKYEHVVII